MCIVCLQFNMYKDLDSAKRMIIKYKKESDIDKDHLEALESVIDSQINQKNLDLTFDMFDWPHDENKDE